MNNKCVFLWLFGVCAQDEDDNYMNRPKMVLPVCYFYTAVFVGVKEMKQVDKQVLLGSVD